MNRKPFQRRRNIGQNQLNRANTDAVGYMSQQNDILGVDVSTQIRKEQKIQHKKMAEKRQIAVEAMRLSHGRQTAEANRAQNKENENEFVKMPKKHVEGARRALFTLNPNAGNEGDTILQRPRAIVKTGHLLSGGAAEMMGRFQKLQITKPGITEKKNIIRYEPAELMLLNPFKKH